MRVSVDQLERQAGAAFKPAYLVAGDEPLLVLEAVDAIRLAARAHGYSERLIFDVTSGFDWPAWVSETRSLGLFASRRLLELRLTATKLSAEGAEAVAQFVRDPGMDALLIQAPEWSRAAEALAWVSAIDRAGAIVAIWPLKPDELPAWLQRRASKLGVRLTEDAVAELVARVEGNLLAAHQELSKLALLADGKALDAAALVDLVADHSRFDVYSLFDAVLAKRPDRARRILRALRGEGVQPAEITGYLISQISALAGAESLRELGGSLSSYWPAARVFGPRQSIYERALGRGWPLRLIEALAVDLCSKGRSSGEPWVEIERWLFRCALPAARAQRFAA